MPDWQELVRQRLSSLALSAAEKEEICAELAGHLEESYDSLRAEGLPDQEAVDQTLAQVANWCDLRWKIFVAKKRGHIMKQRVHQLWIPGFLTFTLSTVFLMTLQKLGFRARIIGDGPNAVLFYVPWLASLPFFGALGAYLSSRAGGSRGTVILASVFPVLALTAAFLLMFPIDLIVKWIIGMEVNFGIVATTVLRDGIGWILLPGAALLVGGLLVHLLFSRRSSSQDTVIG